MAAQTFADLMASERERLNNERAAIFDQQKELEDKLAAINRELAAINAYEAAKSGKAPTAPSGEKKATTPRGPRGPRSESKRGEILKLLQDNPEGLTAAEIATHLGVTGDAAKSVATALSNMEKTGQLEKEKKRGGAYKAKAA